MPRGDKFDQALVFVVRSLAQVNVTKLEKILYLADLEHFHHTGATITGARWVRHRHGPLAKRLTHSRDALADHEISISHELQGEHEAQVYRPGPSPRFDPSLSEAEQGDLRRILAIAAQLNADEMIRLAYNTTPMRFLLAREHGRPRLNVLIPFELDFEVVAQDVGEVAQLDPAERGTFKLQELARIADLQEATLAAAEG